VVVDDNTSQRLGVWPLDRDLTLRCDPTALLTSPPLQVYESERDDRVQSMVFDRFGQMDCEIPSKARTQESPDLNFVALMFQGSAKLMDRLVPEMEGVEIQRDSRHGGGFL
jgi:hypothetical protein